MAGICTVAINMKVTGIGDDIDVANSQVMTVPVEVTKGYSIVTTKATSQALPLGDIAIAKVYGAYIKAEVGVIYIKIDSSTVEAITSANAHLILNEGESAYMPMNGAITSHSGFMIDVGTSLDAYSYVVVGSA